MKFKYYITSLSLGFVIGSNNKDDAIEWASMEDYVVIDAEYGRVLPYDGAPIDIIEAEL